MPRRASPLMLFFSFSFSRFLVFHRFRLYKNKGHCVVACSALSITIGPWGGQESTPERAAGQWDAPRGCRAIDKSARYDERKIYLKKKKKQSNVKTKRGFRGKSGSERAHTPGNEFLSLSLAVVLPFLYFILIFFSGDILSGSAHHRSFRAMRPLGRA